LQNHIKLRKYCYEKNIPTAQYPKKKNTRFQNSYEDQERKKSDRCQTSQREKEISRIKHFTRLKTSKEFNYVYKQATRTWHTPYFVLFYKNIEEQKAGFVASKKIGNAVRRNRAKRLLRAHFIENIDRIKSGNYILVAKPMLLEKSYREIKKAYLHALKKCSALKLSA
jgi:ribonuclease P protein component